MYIHIVCYYVLYMWSWSVFLHLENPTDRVSSQLPSNTSHKDEVNQRDENTSHINGVKPGSSITHLTVYNHPIHSIYHWEKKHIYIALWGVICYLPPFYGNQKQPLIIPKSSIHPGLIQIGIQIGAFQQSRCEETLEWYRYLKILLSHQL